MVGASVLLGIGLYHTVSTVVVPSHSFTLQVSIFCRVSKHAIMRRTLQCGIRNKRQTHSSTPLANAAILEAAALPLHPSLSQLCKVSPVPRLF